MAKLALNLSRALEPLQNELKDTLSLLCPNAKSDKKDDNLFEVIEGFATKYGKSPYSSVDDILNASLTESMYVSSSMTVSFEDALKELSGC